MCFYKALIVEQPLGHHENLVGAGACLSRGRTLRSAAAGIGLLHQCWVGCGAFACWGRLV
jgi:hypothetical protein